LIDVRLVLVLVLTSRGNLGKYANKSAGLSKGSRLPFLLIKPATTFKSQRRAIENREVFRKGLCKKCSQMGYWLLSVQCQLLIKIDGKQLAKFKKVGQN